MNKIINEKIKNGYDLDLGKLLNDGFDIFKKVFFISGLGNLFILIIFFIVFALLGVFFYGVSDLTNFVIEMQGVKSSAAYIIGSILSAVFVSAISAPLNAGLLKLCYNAKRNRAIEINTVFEYFNSKYLKDIILGAVIISVILTTITSIIEYLEISSLLVFGIQTIITLFTIFYLPLVIFGNLSYGEAIEKSIKLAAKNPINIFLLMVIAFIAICLGIFALCIGILFTFPFWSVMNFTLYDHVIGFEEVDVIDEIGSSEF